MELDESKQPLRREHTSSRIAIRNTSQRVNYPTTEEGLLNVWIILKSMISCCLSAVDVATDLWLGLDLIYDFQDQRSGALKIEAEKYGKVVLAVVWLPGFVAVTHLLTYYRHEYLQRKMEFMVKIILLFIFYPLVPPLSLSMIFFYMTNKKEKMEPRLKKYIDQAPTMEGGVEAPIQIMILLFLTMKGFYDLPWSQTNPQNTVKLGYNTLSLPWLPMFSFSISTLSILKSFLVMNALKMYPGKSSLDLIGGFLPFSISAVSFRVLATSFLLIFLGVMAAIPLVVIFIANLVIWYSVAPTIKMPEILVKYLRPESQLEEENGLKINHPFWFNSMISVVIPTCMVNIIDTEAFDENEKDELTTSLHNYHKKYQMKIMRCQIISSTLVILVSVGVTACLVNFSNYNYTPNRLHNDEFNILWGIIMTMGLIHFLFCININIYEDFFCQIPKVTELIRNTKKIKVALKAMITILLGSIILSPAVIGYAYNYQQAQDPIYLVVNNVGSDGAINITTIVTRPYYIPTKNLTNHRDWGQSIKCNEESAEDYFSPTNLLPKYGRNLIIELGNSENQNCYMQLFTKDAEEIKLLEYQSIIVLEDEDFEFRTSRSIHFNIKPNFPIVAVR